MNVGFYYMANAGGRLAGTVLSGLLYEWRARSLPLGLGRLRPRRRLPLADVAERRRRQPSLVLAGVRRARDGGLALEGWGVPLHSPDWLSHRACQPGHGVARRDTSSSGATRGRPREKPPGQGRGTTPSPSPTRFPSLPRGVRESSRPRAWTQSPRGEKRCRQGGSREAEALLGARSAAPDKLSEAGAVLAIRTGGGAPTLRASEREPRSSSGPVAPARRRPGRRGGGGPRSASR